MQTTPPDSADVERRDSGPDNERESRYTSPDEWLDQRRDYDDSSALAQALTTAASPWSAS